MKRNQKVWMVVLALLLAAPMIATAKKKKNDAAAPAAAQKSPSSDETMQRLIMLGMPDEHHKTLDAFVGRWSAVEKGWMKPGDKPQESHGTSEIAWAMGG